MKGCMRRSARAGDGGGPATVKFDPGHVMRRSCRPCNDAKPSGREQYSGLITGTAGGSELMLAIFEPGYAGQRFWRRDDWEATPASERPADAKYFPYLDCWYETRIVMRSADQR